MREEEFFLKVVFHLKFHKISLYKNTQDFENLKNSPEKNHVLSQKVGQNFSKVLK